MSLKEELLELSYELSQIIKKEINKIKDNYQASISYIEKETQKKIDRDLIKIQKEYIENSEAEINRTLSDLIRQMNRKILVTKTALIEQFLKILTFEIEHKVQNKPQEYFNLLHLEIQNIKPLIKTDSWFFLNSHDLEYIKNHKNILPLTDTKLTLYETPIDTICGFKIEAKDGSFILDYTFEMKLKFHHDDISMKFMQIFPVFEFNVENATDLYDKIMHEKKGEKNTNDK